MDQLPAGKLINNRYTVINLVGSGSFASVYKVHDTKLNVTKALKIFPLNDNLEHNFIKLKSEAQNLAQINHQNVIKVYDFDKTDDFFYLDIEFVDGKSLHELIINEQEIDEKKVALEIAEGLLIAHKNGILHKDIKPENILLTNNGAVKISDFGISSAKNEFINDEDNYGSKAYCAPEILKNERAGKASDIFSFGVTLHQLFYHKHPFKIIDGNTDYKISDKLKDSNEPIAEIIKKCLKFNPEERFSDFDEIIKLLKEDNKSYYHKGNTEKKSDVKTIVIVFLALVVLLPIYIHFLFKLFETETKEVFFDSDQNAIYQNHKNIGHRTATYKFKKNDFIQVKDIDGNILYQFNYSGKNSIDLDFEGNRIYLNDKLVGQNISSKADLPILDKINYLKTSINLSDSDYQNKKIEVLLVDGKADSLQQIPTSVKQLYLSNIHKKINFDDFNKNLNLVEFSSTNCNLDLKKINNIRTISKLEIRSSKVVNQHKIGTLINLERIDLDDTNISSVKSFEKLKKLEELSISNNPKLKNISSLNKLENLKNIEVDKKNYEQQVQKKISFNENSRTKKTSPFPKWFRLIIMLLPLFAIPFILYFLLRKENKDKEIPADNIEKSVSKTSKNVVDLTNFRKAVEQENFIKPENKSAIDYLKIQKKQLSKSELKREQKFVTDNFVTYLNKKIEHKLFESAYSEIIKFEKVVNNRKLKKIKKKIIKKMQFISPIKMKKITGGTYWMGDFTQNTQKIAQPIHSVTLSSFEISETMVTNLQFCEYLNSKNCRNPEKNFKTKNSQIIKRKGKYEPVTPFESYPVFNVNWQAAHDFCKWFGGRLPTESEWEYIARNRGEKILYSSGNIADKSNTNYLVENSKNSWHSLVSVKSFPANHLGIYELSGNLLEWCLDDYDKEYYHHSPKKNPLCRSINGLKVIRGGAWCFPKTKMITFFRGFSKITSKTNFIGFRVAKDI